MFTRQRVTSFTWKRSMKWYIRNADIMRIFAFDIERQELADNRKHEIILPAQHKTSTLPFIDRQLPSSITIQTPIRPSLYCIWGTGNLHLVSKSAPVIAHSIRCGNIQTSTLDPPTSHRLCVFHNAVVLPQQFPLRTYPTAVSSINTRLKHSAKYGKSHPTSPFKGCGYE